MLDRLMKQDEIYETEDWQADVHAAMRREHETKYTVLRVSFSFILAFMILLFFSSARLQSWVNGFDVGPVQDRVVLWAGAWNRTMDELGLSHPADVIRKHMAALREASWDDVRILTSDKPREETAIPQHMRGTLAGSEG